MVLLLGQLEPGHVRRNQLCGIVLGRSPRQRVRSQRGPARPSQNPRQQRRPYIDIEAEGEWEFNASGVANYCCFADITDWVAGNPVNARYTVANVIATENNSSWGGWVLVIVYQDALEPMRNLTVFDGLAMIT